MAARVQKRAHIHGVAARIGQAVRLLGVHNRTAVVDVKAQVEAIALVKAHVVVAAARQRRPWRPTQGLQEREQRRCTMEEHIVVHQSQEGRARCEDDCIAPVAQP